MRLFYLVPSLYAFLFLQSAPTGLSNWMDYGLAGGLAVYMVYRYERLAQRINRENAARDVAHAQERAAIANRAETREAEFLAVIKANGEQSGRMVDAVGALVAAAAKLSTGRMCPLAQEVQRVRRD